MNLAQAAMFRSLCLHPDNGGEEFGMDEWALAVDGKGRPFDDMDGYALPFVVFDPALGGWSLDVDAVRASCVISRAETPTVDGAVIGEALSSCPGKSHFADLSGNRLDIHDSLGALVLTIPSGHPVRNVDLACWL